MVRVGLVGGRGGGSVGWVGAELARVRLRAVSFWSASSMSSSNLAALLSRVAPSRRAISSASTITRRDGSMDDWAWVWMSAMRCDGVDCVFARLALALCFFRRRRNIMMTMRRMPKMKRVFGDWKRSQSCSKATD